MGTVNLAFHANQELAFEAFKGGKRFIIMRCGRRFGKTDFCSRISVKVAAEKPEALAWWVSPYYQLSQIGRKKLRKFLKKSGTWDNLVGREYRDPPYYLFQNDSEIRFLTAENEGQLIGEGIDLLIFDECARARASAWQECLAATLFDSPDSRAVFITTPRRRNWFYDLEQHALSEGAMFVDRGVVVEPGDPDCPWAVFHYASYDNPLLSREQIDTVLKISDMPPELVQQEVFAEYIGDTLEAFPGWRECAVGKAAKPEPGHSYAGGFDVGHLRDFCSLSIVDRRTLDEVALLRFKDPDWATQKLRAVALAKLYGATLLMESNGPGDPVLEDVRLTGGLNVSDFVATARSKSMLITHYRNLIANREITLLDDPVGNDEMAAYEISLKPGSNLFSGSAPHGKHDDTVSARMLAFWEAVGSHGAVIPSGVRTTGQRRHAYQLAKVF